MVDMSTTLAGMRLPNPVLTASGCAANGKELQRFFPVAELGAFVTKTVMRDPRSGRPTPRMAETPSGVLNSIGLQGPGIDAFSTHDLAWLAEHGARDLDGARARLVEAGHGSGGGVDLDGEGDRSRRTEGELHAGLAHGDHQHAVVEVLLLRDLHVAGGRLLKARLGGGGAPRMKMLRAALVSASSANKDEV